MSEKEIKHSSSGNEVDKSRELLIQAGLKLFGQNGLEGTTVRDIAQEAGVNLSLVSYYFQGKEGLYRACIQEFARTKQLRAQELLKPAQSFEELRVKLRLLIETMIQDNLHEPNSCKMVLREIDAGLPLASDIFQETLLVSFKVLIDFFHSAQKKKILKKDIDPFAIAAVLHGTIFHMFRTDCVAKKYFNLSLEDKKHRDHMIDQFLNLLLGGIAQVEVNK